LKVARLGCTALFFAVAMRRHGHDDIRGESFGILHADFGKPLCKPLRERFNSLEFQQRNRAHHLVFVKGETSCAIEGVGFQPAC